MRPCWRLVAADDILLDDTEYLIDLNRLHRRLLALSVHAQNP